LGGTGGGLGVHFHVEFFHAGKAGRIGGKNTGAIAGDSFGIEAAAKDAGGIDWRPGNTGG
jgi:hypothetical protein